MSYSVILRYETSGDNHVTLSKPTMHDLKSKIPLFNILSQTYMVKFKDPDGIDIEDNDDLQTAFDEHGRHNLLIKVITIEKTKSKKRIRQHRHKSKRGGSGLGQRSVSYTNDSTQPQNDNNFQSGYGGNTYRGNNNVSVRCQNCWQNRRI